MPLLHSMATRSKQPTATCSSTGNCTAAVGSSPARYVTMVAAASDQPTTALPPAAPSHVASVTLIVAAALQTAPAPAAHQAGCTPASCQHSAHAMPLAQTRFIGAQHIAGISASGRPIACTNRSTHPSSTASGCCRHWQPHTLQVRLLLLRATRQMLLGPAAAVLQCCQAPAVDGIDTTLRSSQGVRTQQLA